MKIEFARYTEAISLSATLTEKVGSICEFWSAISPEEAKWMFISDYLTKEGERVFESVFLASENFIMEAKQFVSSEDFDFVFVRWVYGAELKKQEYDLKQATEKSRLNIHIYCPEGANFDMKASKENCAYLWAFFREYVRPRFHPK